MSVESLKKSKRVRGKGKEKDSEADLKFASYRDDYEREDTDFYDEMDLPLYDELDEMEDKVNDTGKDTSRLNTSVHRDKKYLNSIYLKPVELKIRGEVRETYSIYMCYNYLGISSVFLSNVIRQYFPQVVLSVKGTTLLDKGCMDYFFKYSKDYLRNYLGISDEFKNWKPKPKHYADLSKAIALSIIYDREFINMVMKLPNDKERGFDNYEVYRALASGGKPVKNYLFKGFATFNGDELYDMHMLMVACTVSRKRFLRRVGKIKSINLNGRTSYYGRDLNALFRYSDFDWDKLRLRTVSLESLKTNRKLERIEQAIKQGVLKPNDFGEYYEVDILLLLSDNFNYDVRSVYGRL